MNVDRVFNNDCTIFLFPLLVCFSVSLYSYTLTLLFNVSLFLMFFFLFFVTFRLSLLTLFDGRIGFMFDAIEELPSTKLHTLLLDHHSMKLTWYIDWPKKEVLFNVDEAFTDDTDWFSFGFSKRGQIEGSDVCYFVKSIYDESYNEAIVCIRMKYWILFIYTFCFILFVFLFSLPIGLIYCMWTALNWT